MTNRSRAARTPLLLIATAMSMAVAGTLAARAPGATSATPYEVSRVEAADPETGGRWAERLAVAGDINNDGVNDFFVAAPFQNVNGSNTGRVYLLSGRTRQVLYRIDSPQPQGGASFGFFISAFGDADGDGKSDIAIGTDAQDVGGNQDQGKAWVFSGADGRVLYDLDNPHPQRNARFGSRIGRAGDVNANGFSDIIVGASNNDVPAGCGEDGTVELGCFKDVGQAFIFDGRTGALVRTLDLPPEDRLTPVCSSLCGSFGIAVQGPGDTNGDGVTDQLVGAAGYQAGRGRMYLFSGKDGGVLLKIDSPEPQPVALFGFQDAAPLSPGDVNADGFADLYGNSFLHNGPAGSGQGRAWIFNGRTGAVIRQLDDPTPTAGGQFGWSLSVTDFNRDGRADQYVGQAPHHVQGSRQDGGTYVFDGRNGSVFKRFEVPAFDSDAQPNSAENGGPRLGWANAAPGDLNGDGEPDYLGGAPFTDAGGTQDRGRLYAYLSRAVPAQGPPAQGPPAQGPPAQRPPTQGPPGQRPPAQQPPVSHGTCPTEGAAGYLHPAKMRVRRSRVDRDDRVLDVYAPITSRAEGDVDVTYQGDRRTRTFDAKITSGDAVLDRIRFRKRLTRGQAALGTGIVTLHYKGDADTRPEEVRLRAASQRARLDVDRISLGRNGRLSARGSVTSRANGVVRLRYSYIDAAGNPQIWPARARIQDDGDWELKNRAVPPQLARCGGYLSILFTGLFERRIRGEMLAYELNPGQTRRPRTTEK